MGSTLLASFLLLNGRIGGLLFRQKIELIDVREQLLTSMTFYHFFWLTQRNIWIKLNSLGKSISPAAKLSSNERQNTQFSEDEDERYF